MGASVRLAGALMVAAVLVSAAPARAQSSTSWIGGVGDWSSDPNWDAGEPNAVMDAYIENGGLVDITAITGAAEANSVFIGTIGSGGLAMTGGSLDANEIHIGSGGNFWVFQDFQHDGLLGLQGLMQMQSNHLVLDFGGSGLVSDGMLSDANDLVIGDHGVADFVQIAGSVAADTLVLGRHAGALGTYGLTDGTVTANGTLLVGDSGDGLFTQDGGDVIALAAVVGFDANSTGVYELLDGNVGAGLFTGPLAMGGPGLGLTVGMDGNGTFLQSGGAVTAEVVAIAVTPNSVGRYEISDGSLSVEATGITGMAPLALTEPPPPGTLIVGLGGDGTFDQSGGDVTAGSVIVGLEVGSVGAVNLTDGNMYIGSGGMGMVPLAGGEIGDLGGSGGLTPQGDAIGAPLPGDDLWVGYCGTGTFNQSGGHVYTRSVRVGLDPNGGGSYHLTGGTLHTSGGPWWGQEPDIDFGEGQALFVYDGGQIEPAEYYGATLRYGRGMGTFRVEQGSVRFTQIEVLSYGTNSFIQNGGEVDASFLRIGRNDSDGGHSARYEMNDGRLIVWDYDYFRGNATEMVVASEGVFAQTGGDVEVHDGSLYVGDPYWDELPGVGTYDMSAGTLRVFRHGPGTRGNWGWYPRGHIFIGGSYPWSEGVMNLSGGQVFASRLFIAPFGDPWGGEYAGDAAIGEEGGIGLMGPGRLQMSGGFMHLDGDGDLFEPPSTVGGVIEGFGTIVSAGPIEVLQDAAIIAYESTLTINAELQCAGYVEVAPFSELRTHGSLSGGEPSEWIEWEESGGQGGPGGLGGGVFVDEGGRLTAYGGDLRVTGVLVNLGTLSNRPGTSLQVDSYDVAHMGSIDAYAGGGVSFATPIVNGPHQEIRLFGGSVEAPQIWNEPNAMIRGHGQIFAEGGLANFGSADFDGTAWIFGDLHNHPFGTVNVTNGDLHVTGDTVNDPNALIKVTNGQFYWDGALTNNGVIDIDPAVGVVSGDMDVGPGGVVTLDAFSKL